MCGCGWVFLGLVSRRTLVVTRWLRLIVKKMTCVTKKRSVLQQYWNTGTSFAPKIPGQTPSTVFFMLTCKNWAPKIGFEPCKTKKSTCLLLFWITISFGGNAPAVFWSSTRPACHNHIRAETPHDSTPAHIVTIRIVCITKKDQNQFDYQKIPALKNQPIWRMTMSIFWFDLA